MVITYYPPNTKESSIITNFFNKQMIEHNLRKLKKFEGLFNGIYLKQFSKEKLQDVKNQLEAFYSIVKQIPEDQLDNQNRDRKKMYEIATGITPSTSNEPSETIIPETTNNNNIEQDTSKNDRTEETFSTSNNKSIKQDTNNNEQITNESTDEISPPSDSNKRTVKSVLEATTFLQEYINDLNRKKIEIQGLYEGAHQYKFRKEIYTPILMEVQKIMSGIFSNIEFTIPENFKGIPRSIARTPKIKRQVSKKDVSKKSESTNEAPTIP